MDISQIDIDVAIAELLASSEPTYSKDHVPAIRVPKGGSSCSSCEYLADNKTDCTNEHFQKWNGSATIPAPIDEFCSDWYEEDKDIEASYKLEDRTTFRGLNISIETDKGSERSGVGKDGKPWSVKMTYPYGYIRMTEGVDGDHVDCFLGPDEDAEDVYVIHTKEPTTGDYDEDKCMLGFPSASRAKKAFLENYSDPAFFGSMDVIPFDKFTEKALATKAEPAMIEAGGPGSGCNPEVADPKCGRPAGTSSSSPDTDKVQAVIDWQEGPEPIKAAARGIITGQPPSNEEVYGLPDRYNHYAQLLLDGIRNGDTFDRPLYRGISLYDPNSPILQLKAGDDFQMADIASFSQNQQVGRNFSIGFKPNDIHVVFQTDGPIRGLDTNKFDTHPEKIGMQDESEVISNGRFQVTQVEDQKGYSFMYHTIHIKQLGTL